MNHILVNTFYTLTEMADSIGESMPDAVSEVVENPSLIKRWLDSATPKVISFAIQLVITVVILLVGLKVINVIVRVLKRSFERGNVEKGVATFLCSVIKYILYFILVMILLSQFGVTTGSVVAVLGSAGLTVGLALQGSLANFAGGVLILVLKPFVVGDYILAEGTEGTVEGITIFYTRLLSIDNKLVVIPNGTLSNSIITNVSHMDIRRVDIRVGVDYASDLAKVKDVMMNVATSDEAVLKDSQIDVFVAELADSSVNMEVRVWVNNADYWATKWRMTENIKNAFEENGIEIPYPHMHIMNESNH